MRRLVIIAILTLLVLALVYPLALALVAFNSPVPNIVGVGDPLRCPPTPNCVSSLTNERAEASVLPLYYTGEQFIAEALLLDAIETLPGTQIAFRNDGYIHVEKRTGLLRLVTDMEFRFDDAAQEITVRSASRLGNSDGGASRRHLEHIRDEFTQLQR